MLCIERQSHGIQYAISSSLWIPPELSSTGPLLLHLFFANDLVLFAKASLAQVEVVKGVLKDFCACLG